MKYSVFIPRVYTTVFYMFTLPSVYSDSSPHGLLIQFSIIFMLTQEDLQTFVWCSLLEAYTDTRKKERRPQRFGGFGEKGYLYAGSLGALVIIFRDLRSKSFPYLQS